MENELDEFLENYDILKSSKYIQNEHKSELTQEDKDYIMEKQTQGYWYNHEAEEYFSFLLRDMKKPGLIISDLDFAFLSTNNNNFFLMDHKTHNAGLRPGQEKLYRVLDSILKKQDTVRYIGFYLLVFENSTFTNGKVWLKKPFVENWEDKLIPDMDYFKRKINLQM